MPDFESLVEELLRIRPDLTRGELELRVKGKKETVGAGYLTEQGALYLVAGELGVSLQPTSPPEMRIKDVYIGANDMTVVARVLAVYPVSTYIRKKDGGEGRYRRLAIFDGQQSVRLTAWDQQVDEIEKIGIKADTAVRIVSAYVKQGLDGRPNLNIGNRGRIEIVSDPQVAGKLTPLAGVTEGLSKITQERQFLAVECDVKSEPRYSEFVRSDGSSGSLFQFSAMGVSGQSEARVVVWSPSDRPNLKPGQRVVVTNLRSRRASTGEFELHGDAGTAILPGDVKVPIEFRVACVSEAPTGKSVLAIGTDMKVRTILVGKGLVVPIRNDAILVCADTKSGETMVCNTPESMRITKESLIPELDRLVTKLRDAKDEGALVMVEVIALSKGTVEEVQLRDGSTAKLGEFLVGDDTGETRMVGWREHSEQVRGIRPGDRLRMVGVTVKSSKTGGRNLQIFTTSVVEVIRSAS